LNAQGHGIYRSVDNGDSWQPVNTGLTNLTIQDIVITPNNHVFAATWSGVFRSTDQGLSWTLMNTDAVEVIALATNENGHLFAGTYGSGVYRSTDEGDSWRAVNSGLANRNVYVLAVNVDGLALAATYGGGVYCSAQPTD
jgi:photosystem II stability/assembly factor-like uncharacterized protein